MKVQNISALESEYQNLQMEDDAEDPDMFIGKLIKLNTQMREIKTDAAKTEYILCMNIINRLPDVYLLHKETVLKKLDTLDAESLKRETEEYWERNIEVKDTPKKKSSVTEEMKALNVDAPQTRRFNGDCNFCGRKGHKEKDCWKKHGRPGNRKKGGYNNFLKKSKNKDCHRCGQPGHIARNCPKKDAASGLFVGGITAHVEAEVSAGNENPISQVKARVEAELKVFSDRPSWNKDPSTEKVYGWGPDA